MQTHSLISVTQRTDVQEYWTKPSGDVVRKACKRTTESRLMPINICKPSCIEFIEPLKESIDQQTSTVDYIGNTSALEERQSPQFI